MSQNFQDPISRSAVSSISIDQGLRSYMTKIYNTMGMGLAVTGFVAYFISMQPALMQMLFQTGLSYIVMLAPIAFVFLISAKINSFEVGTLRTLFFVYATLMGVSLSFIFLVFTGGSIAKTFFICSSMFLSTSIYGYTTKRDLTAFGSFFMMGLFGLIIASLVNIFVQSSVFDLALSAVGVVIFTGLAAYKTQMFKEMYSSYDSEDALSRKIIFAALSLYLDFINLFMSLLRFFGDRR